MYLKSLFNEDKTLFAFYILVLFVPLALILGPAVADIIISLSGIIFIYYLFKHRSFDKFLNLLSFLILLWLSYLIIISLLSNDPKLSLEASLFYFRFFIFLAASLTLLNNKYILKYITISIFSIFLILIFDSYFQYIFGYNLIGLKYDPNVIVRVSSFFNEELVLGGYLAKFSPILCALLIYHLSDRGHLLSMLILPFIFGCIMLSGERSALFIYMLFVLFYYLLTFKKFFKYKIFSILSLLIIFFTLIITDNNIKHRILNFTFQQLNINLNNISDINENKIYFISREHESHFRSALMMFNDNKLLGIGPKIFRIKCGELKYIGNEDPRHPDHSCSTHPHNYYIQLLAETGVIGFFPFVVLYIYFLYRFILEIFNKENSQEYKIIFLFSILLLFFPFVPTGNIFNNWLSSINFYILSICLLFIFKKNNV